MSFLKKFFDKVVNDEDRYGKGHRLGDSQTAELERQRQLEQQQQQRAALAASSQRPQTAAAQAAGQAALARLQQQQQQKPSKSNPIRKQLAKEAEQEEKDLEKARQLKEHYFGAKHEIVIDKPAHYINILFKSKFLPPGTRLPRHEIEALIEQQLFDNLNSEPILTCLTLLTTANYRTPDKLEKCFEILNKLVENIQNNPNEEKYRKIRIENEHIKQKLLSLKYSELVLDTLGFKLTQQYNEDLKVEEKIYLFDMENFKNLSEFKEGQNYVEAIRPELDRNVKVFTTSQNDANPMSNLSDDFYSMTVNELKSELKSREANLEKLQMFRTKAMRERDEHLEQRRYIYCVVRIKFPQDLFLQGIFHTRETLKDVYVFVQSCLANEQTQFELVSTSVLGKSSFQISLDELGLAPASVLHFKCNDGLMNGSSFLKNEVLALIHK